MTRTYKHRVIFSIAVMFLATVLGAAAGLLLGCALVLHQTQQQLGTYAQDVQERATAFIGEASVLLNRLNSTSLPFCTQADLAQMRRLIFNAEYVHEVGRISGGRVVCTAMMGRLPASIAVTDAAYEEKVGNNIYRHFRDLPALNSTHGGNVGLQLGDYYAVYSPFRFAHLGAPQIGFFRLVGDPKPAFIREMMRGILDTDRYVLYQDGTLWENGNLFVTRCNAPRTRSSCSTAFIPVRLALLTNRSQIIICASAGVLVGLLLGLCCAVLFQRSQSMERQLRRAIHGNKVQLAYQPIVELASGRMVAVEALARWTDEDGFSVSPALFVVLAEERGFIGELTELVIRQALSDLKPLLTLDPALCVNINVTATDLASEGFLPTLDRTLAEAKVAARNLAIEITESSTAHLPAIRETIRQLRQRGHSVEIDDFGTGYSSLSYLHDLSIDAIKIDRGFTQAIGTEAVTVGILPQILAMAQALHLKVIVEGIETAEQAAYFAASEMKILGQGWFFGRPMRAEKLRSMVAELATQSELVE